MEAAVKTTAGWKRRARGELFKSELHAAFKKGGFFVPKSFL
jgi:hypothetical protein